MKRLTQENIVYEDNHLLVLSKEPGLLTQPAPSDDRDSLEEMAKRYIKAAYNKPGKVFLHAVHRIDRQVSGLVIFARTDKGLSRLNKAMREKRIIKVYHALVEGEVQTQPDKVVQLHNYISHKNHYAEVSAKKKEGSLEARLSYSLLDRDEGQSLLEIHLDTGRYHQIRAQLAFSGHPICGDKRYGATTSFGPKSAIALHSHNCKFPHPTKQETLDLVAEYPPIWHQLSKLMTKQK